MSADGLSRRAWMRTMIGAGVVAGMSAMSRTASALVAEPVVKVYKDPNCGCCKKWVSHLESKGFKVIAQDRNDMNAMKDSLGVPSTLRSCHTAVVGTLVIEGHVPAMDIRKALTHAPKGMLGLAVPGMPAGSPGMEMGGRTDRYDVIAFTAKGSTSVFATHG